MNISTPMYPPSADNVEPIFDLHFAPTTNGWRVSVTKPDTLDVVGFIDLNARECTHLSNLLRPA